MAQNRDQSSYQSLQKNPQISVQAKISSINSILEEQPGNGSAAQANSLDKRLVNTTRQAPITSNLVSLLKSSNPQSGAPVVQKPHVNSASNFQSQQSSVRLNGQSSFQPLIYRKPVGPAANKNGMSQGCSISRFHPVSSSWRSDFSSVALVNSTKIRGLSPQKNASQQCYPSYVRLDARNAEGKSMEQGPPKKFGIGRNVMSIAKNVNSSISPVAKGLEGLLSRNGEQKNIHEIGSKRVKMGCSPTSHTPSRWSNGPPPILVISSDEEDNEEAERDPVGSNSGSRIGISNMKRSLPISEAALNIAMQLSANGTSQVEHSPKQFDGQSIMASLSYGLSILDEPQKILESLENVLKEKPKRLRVNAKTLYAHAKLGCMSKVLSVILENVSPVEPVPSEDERSALHAAAANGHLEVLVILVYRAAGQVDVMDKFKRTPLFIAVENGHLQVAQFLHRAGASLSCKNFDGMGLLHLAAYRGHTQVLKWLLSHIKDLDEQDNGGWTSLMWAAESGHEEAFKLLVRKGARMDLRDKELNTVLHWMSMAGSFEGCELLLSKAYHVINSVNMYGDTALHIAARESNVQVVKLFLLRGADTSIRNKENKLPMDVCVNHPQIRDMIKLRHAIGQQIEKYLYDCDISKGKERIPVSCINEIDDEPLPRNFTYITEPIESSTVSIMKDLLSVKGCKCQDDCTLNSCECVRNNEDGRCWYEDGILDERFLDFDQPVLFECSKLCRCWSHCSNRVVQKGISFRLEVFKTVNQGWSLRTISPIPKGSFVLSYVGEVISDEEADRRSNDSYLFDLDMKNSDEEENCLDANHYGNCGRFINHSCDSNLVPVRVFTHHRDWRVPGIAFFASRDINACEALSFDYGDKFWEIKLKSGLRCLCDSDQCKYIK